MNFYQTTNPEIWNYISTSCCLTVCPIIVTSAQAACQVRQL